MCDLFNLSLQSGTIPAAWKIGRIRPIYKGKGSKDDPTNYRPISVISHISKIIEKIVKTQLVNFLETHHIMSPFQSAFLKYHSTLSRVNVCVAFRMSLYFRILIASYDQMLSKWRCVIGIFWLLDFRCRVLF